MAQLKNLSTDIKETGFKYALLIGMGGSSLGPAVLAASFGYKTGFPEFFMLDSTVPSQIKDIESKIDIDKTIFIVSSKSGSTLEPNVLKDYFYQRVKDTVGAKKAGQQFIAITDPGSQLEQIAKKEEFRYIFYGLPSIGGRYSILSAFGMVPAAVMGIDIEHFLKNAQSMVHECQIETPTSSNSGLVLGTILGVLANENRNKVTFIVSKPIASLGAWLEQLLAESTGKSGKGLIPIDNEDLLSPSEYGNDRVFVYLRLKDQADTKQDTFVAELHKSSSPIVTIELENIYDLAQEFFRFEFATAIAGSIMKINPFNQPDVEASKVATRNITNEYEKTGKLQTEDPLFTQTEKNCSVEVFTDEDNWQLINKSKKSVNSLESILASFFEQVTAGDYVAILAYLQMNESNESAIQEIRSSIQHHLKVATCVGFGPRYLHSTGQVYKGGPNTGIFLEISADENIDLAIPNKKYTFAVVKNAQAMGDFQVLCERKRRALRINIKGNLITGLSILKKYIDQSHKAII